LRARLINVVMLGLRLRFGRGVSTSTSNGGCEISRPISKASRDGARPYTNLEHRRMPRAKPPQYAIVETAD
jgi:hypothetical protein